MLLPADDLQIAKFAILLSHSYIDYYWIVVLQIGWAKSFAQKLK